MGEIFKTLKRLNANIMWDSFDFKDPNKYELRWGCNLVIPKGRTAKVINLFDFRAALAWNHLHIHVKTAENLVEFKEILKKETIYCRCLNCT